MVKDAHDSCNTLDSKAAYAHADDGARPRRAILYTKAIDEKSSLHP